VTPIKRVRIIQSKTSEKKLPQSKFGAKNKQGEIFKWVSYNNFHHVEIIQDKTNGKFSGIFVSMMEAHRRAMTNTASAQKRKVLFEPIIQKKHGENSLFVMALHKNDIVSLKTNKGRTFYRVQKLENLNKRIKLRLHTAATEKNPAETLTDRDSSIPALMAKDLKLHKVNALGKILDD